MAQHRTAMAIVEMDTLTRRLMVDPPLSAVECAGV
jgi:hypothetical protein